MEETRRLEIIAALEKYWADPDGAWLGRVNATKDELAYLGIVVDPATGEARWGEPPPVEQETATDPQGEGLARE